MNLDSYTLVTLVYWRRVLHIHFSENRKNEYFHFYLLDFWVRYLYLLLFQETVLQNKLQKKILKVLYGALIIEA